MKEKNNISKVVLIISVYLIIASLFSLFSLLSGIENGIMNSITGFLGLPRMIAASISNIIAVQNGVQIDLKSVSVNSTNSEIDMLINNQKEMESNHITYTFIFSFIFLILSALAILKDKIGIFISYFAPVLGLIIIPIGYIFGRRVFPQMDSSVHIAYILAMVVSLILFLLLIFSAKRRTQE